MYLYNNQYIIDSKYNYKSEHYRLSIILENIYKEKICCRHFNDDKLIIVQNTNFFYGENRIKILDFRDLDSDLRKLNRYCKLYGKNTDIYFYILNTENNFIAPIIKNDKKEWYIDYNNKKYLKDEIENITRYLYDMYHTRIIIYNRATINDMLSTEKKNN